MIHNNDIEILEILRILICQLDLTDKLTFVIWIYAKFRDTGIIRWSTFTILLFSQRLYVTLVNSRTFYDRALVYLHFYQLLRTFSAPWEKQRRTERNARNLPNNNFLLCINVAKPTRGIWACSPISHILAFASFIHVPLKTCRLMRPAHDTEKIL